MNTTPTGTARLKRTPKATSGPGNTTKTPRDRGSQSARERFSAKASEFTPNQRDAHRALKITDPSTPPNINIPINVNYHGNSHTTKYTYDGDNELINTEEPNKTVTETEYDSMGQVKSQTDGNKHVTKYVRNALEEVEEVVNPLGKKALKEYDLAGNLVKLTDPEKRTTTYTYDPKPSHRNQLLERQTSDGQI